jgi:DNA-binding winged helix-turn-helix (wHTH) protein/tetratricopeptide (TPR) repeat protein
MTEAVTSVAAEVRERAETGDFRLGAVTVSPGSGSAEGPGGSVQLDPRVMDVLVCLARARGEVVSRDCLMAEVWGDVIVTDFALSRCIYQLRKQLPQVAQTEDPPIETLPKRGYRILWPVGEVDLKSNTSVSRTPGFLAIGVVVGLVAVIGGLFLFLPRTEPAPEDGGSSGSGPATVRLAIFPLEDLSEEGEHAVFARGLSKELVHELARFPDLIVMGRTSSFGEFAETTSELEHATRLGVDYALGGSVVSAGAGRRVLLQLCRVPSGEQVWSHSFLLDSSTPLQVFRGVAEFTAMLFEWSMDPVKTSGMTDNLEAFELYLAGFETNSLEAERLILERAVQIDPEFAQAWITLASIEVYPVWNGEQTIDEAWSRARPYLDRALEIDPDSSAAYVELGRFKRELGELDESIAYYRKALELDPGNIWASANLGMVLRRAGEFEEALAWHEQNVAMDPLDVHAQTRLGTSNWFLENFEEAELHYRIANELDPMEEEVYDSWAGMLGVGLGRVDEALVKMQRKASVENPPTVRTLVTAAWLASKLGLDQMAQEYWRQVLRISPDNVDVASDQAVFLMARNERGLAETAARAVLGRSPMELRAQLILAILDLQEGRAGEFLARVDEAYSGIVRGEILPRIPDIEASQLVALALETNGFHEEALQLLERIKTRLTNPRGREHFWLATTHAMLGEGDEALAELRASPPGRVRIRAPLLLQDPRFASLQDNLDFRELVDAHLQELERQRISYLAGTSENAASVSQN